MFYRAIRFLVLLYLAAFNRWKIEGKENIPPTGPVVLVANHISNWDPLILACSVQRTVHYMAKEELFRIPLLRTILHWVQCFPVKRGRADRNALRLADTYLEKGEVLGLFPEGTRSKTVEMLPFLPGAALFALRSQAPIVPVGLIGSRTTFPNSLRGNLLVRIGKPLYYTELYGKKITNEEMEKVMADVKKHVSELIRRTPAEA